MAAKTDNKLHEDLPDNLKIPNPMMFEPNSGNNKKVVRDSSSSRSSSSSESQELFDSPKKKKEAKQGQEATQWTEGASTVLPLVWRPYVYLLSKT